MFKDIIKSMETELDGLRAKRVKCEEFMEKVRSRENKARLSTQYNIIRHDIERVCLCISILAYQVSVEISEDFTEVRFPPVPKPEDDLKEADNGKVQNMRLL